MKEIMHFQSNEDRHAYILGYVKATEFKEAKTAEKKPEKKADPKKTTKKKEEK